MTHDLISLSIIALVAFVSPVIAQIIPGKPVPETVLLLAFGAILGPNCLDAIWLTDPVGLLSELGLAFLFLLAGYEIDPKMLAGTEGRKGLRTWLVTFAAALPALSKRGGTRLYRFLEAKANTTSQTFVRGTVMILIALVAFSSLFDLDIVLGAFAAGFVLRFIIPEGSTSLEPKLDAIGFGFLIPVFFVVSGAKVDLSAVASDPAMLIRFIVMLVVIRAMPIVISLGMGKTREDYTVHERISVALYCTTALPIIVAVTALCVKNGSMDSATASIMVAAGAVTVFLMPLLAQVAYGVADRHPLDAVREIAHNPKDARRIISEHVHADREHARSDYKNVYLPKR